MNDGSLAALRKEAADAGANDTGQYLKWLEARVLELRRTKKVETERKEAAEARVQKLLVKLEEIWG